MQVAPIAVFILTLACGPGERTGVHHGAARVARAGPPPARAAYEPERLFRAAARESIGENLGRYQLTYYWVAQQNQAGQGAVLRDAACRPIARVSAGFARRVKLEGTGRLLDGRVVNVAGRCRCGSVCYFVTNGDRRSWGVGVRNRPLHPFRSIAVDPRRIPIGSWVYVPELDGMWMPRRGDTGGFLHDGCLVADDRGGGVRGRQIDFFTGRRALYRDLHQAHGLARVSLFDGGAHCAAHERRTALASASKGAIASSADASR